MTVMGRILILLLMMLITSMVQAHKINMFAYPEGDQIFIEGYFTDGVKPMDSLVTVYDSAGNELLTGRTNNEGQYQFDIPKQDDLRIVLYVGEGHQTDYVISREELAGEEVVVADESASVTGAGAGANAVSEAMVRKAVGVAIRPLMRSINEMKEQRGFSDIVGGIGFIFGIAGIFFYLKARKLSAK